MKIDDAYKNAATHALAGFQLIEAQLKEYISDYYDKVKELLPSNMTFEHSFADVENVPLGGLLKIFKKINGNGELIKSLDALLSKRNHLAHRALIILYGTPAESFDFDKNLDELIALAEELGVHLNAVFDERAKLLAISKDKK